VSTFPDGNHYLLKRQVHRLWRGIAMSFRIWILLIGPLLGLGLMAAIVAVPFGARAQQSKTAVFIEARTVAVAAVLDEVTAVGTLKSNESVIVRPEIAGAVVNIHFDEGIPVAKGALLFSLDDSIYRAELAEAEASLTLSERNIVRARELYRKGAGTAQARDEATARLETDRAAVALVGARIAKTQISAPFAGIVGFREVSVGDYVTAGQPLVNLEDIGPIKVEFQVAERYLPQVATGQEITLTLDPYPGHIFEGAVYAINPLIDPSTRSIALRGRIENKDLLMRPGLFARVRLVVGRRQGAILVVEQAIVPRGGARFVFRVVDGKAVLTKVETGKRRGGRVEITDGLKKGDVVVTAGQLKIRDGSPVKTVAAGS